MHFRIYKSHRLLPWMIIKKTDNFFDKNKQYKKLSFIKATQSEHDSVKIEFYYDRIHMSDIQIPKNNQFLPREDNQ
jgi:hypothetical protein